MQEHAPHILRLFSQFMVAFNMDRGHLWGDIPDRAMSRCAKCTPSWALNQKYQFSAEFFYSFHFLSKD
jgi:hypothetical protein